MIFPGTLHWRFSSRSKNYWINWIANQNNSKEESSSCRCTTTPYGEIRKANEYVLLIPSLWLPMQRSSLWVIGHSSSQVHKRNGTRQTLSNLEEKRDRVAELMILNLRKSGHPIFRATSALERGTLKSKGGGKSSIHFCGDCDTEEVIIRTIVSVNQLSIYGAVADMWEEFVTPLTDTRKTYAVMEQSESTVTSADLLNLQRPLLTNEQSQGDLLQNHKEWVNNFPNDEQLIKLCADAWFI